MAAAKKKTQAEETITISPPRFKVATFHLRGTAPLVQLRFSQKAMQKMIADMSAGQRTKKGKTREPRDWDDDFRQAMHVSTEGWVGIPAAAIRNACIDVCRMVGYKMTHAKMSIFAEADGLDAVDGQPLIRLDAGEPERMTMPVRNANGSTDLRVRPMWREWGLKVRIRYDADQFSRDDVANLLARAGVQCGLGEGRPFSRMSNGMGYGTFEIAAVE